MKLKAVICVSCILGSILVLLPTLPTASAQGVGWGTPVRIDTGVAVDAKYPQIGIDSRGNIIAVWEQSDGTRFNIWANRYIAGSGWGTAELIETDDTGNAEYPQIAVDPSGNATAVWQQKSGAHVSIFANRYTVGAGWGMAELVETDDVGDAGLPSVAVDPSGNATAIWNQSDIAHSHIYANRYIVGTGWGTPELLETDNTHDAHNADVAVDATGNAMAVWVQSDGTTNNIYSNRYVVGTGWGTRELAETNPATYFGYPKVAVDPVGNAIAIWIEWEWNTFYFNVSANRYAVGTGWGTDKQLAVHATDPQVALDSSGNAMAAWSKWNDSRHDIYADRYSISTGWGTPEKIMLPGPASGRTPQVAIDATGNVTAVWCQAGIRSQIYANRYVIGSGWGNAEPVETDSTEDAWLPQVVVDATGNATAVWQYDISTGSQIWANQYTFYDWAPPVANAGPDQTVVARDLVTFDGSGSTDNVDIISYNWTFDDGGMRTLSGASPTYSFYSPGVFTVTLTVEDAAGYNDTDTVVITVNPAPDTERPVANAGLDQSITAGTLVTFDGSGSTDNVGVVNYTWTFSDGGIRTLYGVSPTYTFNKISIFVVTLTARDAAGNSDADKMVVVVIPQTDTEAPVANAGLWRTIIVGSTIVIDGSRSTDNVGIVNYTWKFYDKAWIYRYAMMWDYQFNNVGSIAIDLVVRDAANNSDMDTIVITIDRPPDTERPVANAGPDQSVVTGTTVTFNGSASSDNVGIDSHVWTFDDGGLQVLSGITPTYKFNNAGMFVVTLKVRDRVGNNDSDVVIITVSPPPDTRAPTANAGPDRSITAGTTIILDGSGSTDDVGVVNYTWSLDDGGVKFMYSMMWAYRFDNIGVFTTTLEVRDAAGNSDTDTAVITVTAADDNERPVADAGPNQYIVAGTTVVFDGSGSTDNVGITNYTWTFNDGGARTLFKVAPTYRFDNVGAFIVTMTAKDAAGNSDTDEVLITVNPPPDTQPPTANAGMDRSIFAGTTTVLDGSASVDNVGVVNYTWSFDDGGMKYRYTAMFAYQFDNVGVFTITLTVKDAAGNPNTDIVVITVNPAPDTERPVADAGPDQSVAAGAAVTFDGSGSTDNVGVVNYTWEFDDEGARTLHDVSPSYTFGDAGVFVVTLTVKDAAGNSDVDEILVKVAPPRDTEAPVAEAGPERDIASGTTIVLDGSASTDNVGIVNYTWTFTHGGVAQTLWGQLASFRFDVAGDCTVTLTVKDAAGNSDTDTVNVTVATGGAGNEVISPLAMMIILVLAVLTCLFAAMFIRARRKKGGQAPDEEGGSKADSGDATGESEEEEMTQ